MTPWTRPFGALVLIIWVGYLILGVLSERIQGTVDLALFAVIGFVLSFNAAAFALDRPMHLGGPEIPPAGTVSALLFRVVCLLLVAGVSALAMTTG